MRRSLRYRMSAMHAGHGALKIGPICKTLINLVRGCVSVVMVVRRALLCHVKTNVCLSMTR